MARSVGDNAPLPHRSQRSRSIAIRDRSQKMKHTVHVRWYGFAVDEPVSIGSQDLGATPQDMQRDWFDGDWTFSKPSHRHHRDVASIRNAVLKKSTASEKAASVASGSKRGPSSRMKAPD